MDDKKIQEKVLFANCFFNEFAEIFLQTKVA